MKDIAKDILIDLLKGLGFGKYGMFSGLFIEKFNNATCGKYNFQITEWVPNKRAEVTGTYNGATVTATYELTNENLITDVKLKFS